MAKAKDGIIYGIVIAHSGKLYRSGSYNKDGQPRPVRWSNGRAYWTTFAAAKRAFLAMPEAIQEDAYIQEYELVPSRTHAVTAARQKLT